MAEQPQQWTKLVCDSCGVSQEFYQKLHLITRQGGGTTHEPAGYACRQCGADVDGARMIARLDRERKRAELKALEEEIRNQETEPAAKR